MKVPFQPFFRSLRIVILATLLLMPAASHAQDTTSTDPPSWMEELAAAIRDWLASMNSDSGSDDGGTDSGTDSVAAADDSSSASPPLSAPATTAPAPGGATVNPDALAQAIAREAGGHAQQYVDYSEKLAATLSHLTPAQRARVFNH